MTRNNIVRFPGGSGRSRSTSVEADRLATHEHVAPAGGESPVPVQPSAGVRAASGVLYGVRYAIFLLLMWMRGPLRFLLGLIGVPALFALPLVWLGYEGANKGELLLLCGVGAFGAFALGWFYDSLVLALAPEPIFLN